MKNFKKKALQAALTIATAGMITAQAQAANWLMLQGTEAEGTAPRAKVWGFIQAQYQKDYSDACKTNCNPPANTLSNVYIPPKMVGPDLTSQEQFNVNRARLGVRGTGMPLDSKVNYFLLAEFGNNAITNAGEDFTRLTDASITLNHIPGARLRIGLFKTPGPEEALQAIHVFDYVNFTEVSNQLMLERFPTPYYKGNVPPVSIPTNTSNGGLNQFEGPVGAFRDTGIQVFDTFSFGVENFEFSYAAMYGNGNGIEMHDPDDNKDVYGYVSAEWIYGGTGPRREGLKVFAWAQNGKRLLDNTDDGLFNPQEFDRKRSGIGVKYLKKPFRVSAEYMTGKGMIFVGPDKPTFDQNGVVDQDGTGNCPGSSNTVSCQAADGSKSEASGYYVDFGFYIPNSNWELDARYDVYNRLEGDPGQSAGPNAGKSFESEWVTWTLGAQYHFNRKTRVTMNYAIRDVETPAFGPGAGPNGNMDGIGDRASVQLTHIF